MLQPIPSSGRDTSRIRTLPAPTGGWNALDPVADMPADDAIFLDNFFPRTSDCLLRKGRVGLAKLPSGESIRTLIGYKNTDGSSKLFAAGNAGIYDLSSEPPLLATLATNSAWQTVASTTPGGSYLLACNGVDNTCLFNGTYWLELTETSTPSLTGIPSKEIVNVSKFKTQLIFCRKDSMSFYYLPANAIAGAAVEYPLGTIFSKGGYLVATAAWTIDGGNGPDDYFIAITSEGEVAVYSGTDPSIDFRKVGTFQLAKPMGRRCFLQLADDLVVLTQGAIYPLSQSLQKGTTDGRKALSRKIEKAYAEAAAQGKELFGWEAAFFPEQSMMLVNVPTLNYPSQRIVYTNQFVMNTITRKWCRFTNWSAEAILAFDGKLYAALHDRVWELWTGYTDEGQAIVGNAKTAPAALGTSSAKQVKLVRPQMQAGADINLRLGLDVDYRDNDFVTSEVSYLQQLSLWDSSVWNGAVWNGSSRTISAWRSVACRVGSMFSVRLRATVSNASMTWLATNIIVEDAGIKG